MLSLRSTYRVVGGEEGVSALQAFPREVPDRQCGRENWHRERVGILALLEHLVIHQPSLFPAMLVRQQAPDFLLCSESGALTVAIEHTEVGAEDFQRTLDHEACSDPSAITPIGARYGANGEMTGLREWNGDAAERLWQSDVQDALMRKRPQKFWRNADASCPRWILAYDNSEGSIFVSDDTALCTLRQIAELSASRSDQISALAMVRGAQRVLVEHIADRAR